jgi:hypothetical protein
MRLGVLWPQYVSLYLSVTLIVKYVLIKFSRVISPKLGYFFDVKLTCYITLFAGLNPNFKIAIN